MRLAILKSGSDIRGTAVATSNEKVNLDSFIVQKIGKAFVKWLEQRKIAAAKLEAAAKGDIRASLDNSSQSSVRLSIAVGMDSRITSEAFRDALVHTFSSLGVSVFDCGLASTPSMYLMTKHPDTDCDGAVMITASHHPSHKNGLKFFTKEGGVSHDDIAAIISLAEAKDIDKFKNGLDAPGTITTGDYTKTHYAPMLVKMVEDRLRQKAPLKGLRIVVDAGNGAGGFFATDVLAPLGANIDGSQFLEPNGYFPNHEPNPENPRAMQSIKECVLKTSANLGIIFDTDVDRAGFVAQDGTEINRDCLIALVAALVAPQKKGSIIVTDSVTSDGLTKFIEGVGGEHFRYKRGYQNVISKAKELNAQGKFAPIAAETSGHVAFLDNDFLDDGAYLACRILVAMAALKNRKGGITSLISSLEKPASEFEVRIGIKKSEMFKEYTGEIIADLKEYASEVDNIKLAPNNFDGVRANVEQAHGWFLLRPSVHDPNMILNIQSTHPLGAYAIARAVFAYLSEFDKLILDDLKEYITN